MSVQAVSSTAVVTHDNESEPVKQRRLAEAGDRQVCELVTLARAAGDEMRRRALFEAVLVGRPMAAALARRYHRRGIDEQDLEQVAMLGLCKAVRGFQPARGVRFAAYAVPTITGELKRHFRDTGWMVRPTRSLQEFGRTMRAAEERLVQRSGHQPSTVEVAEFLDVPVEQVDQARQAERGFWAGSLDTQASDCGEQWRPGGSTGQAIGVTLADPHDDFELVDAALVVGPALATLTPRERRIIKLRYVNGMTQAEIGALIGVTQMQVSRLLRDVLVKLRTRISEPSGGLA